MPTLPHAKSIDPAKSADEQITPELLQAWPLPQPDGDGDKDMRGRVLVVGGSPEMPGAIILAATAALRSGAGKLQIATCRSIAPHVAIAVPEARVFALPETPAGGIDPQAAAELAERASQVETTLLGPGMLDEAGTRALLEQFLPQLDHTLVVLDAIALSCGIHIETILAGCAANTILTPHAGEMATMLGVDKAAVLADPPGVVRQAAARLSAVIALKGGVTFIAAPDGALYQYRSGDVGLATSGSGDTLAGIVAGLAARGAAPIQAASWGVYLHGAAGNQLAKRMGRTGYLARELLDEIPLVMNRLTDQLPEPVPH
jgi:ADP-dependent NAD(P)H-hydrate dehydratase